MRFIGNKENIVDKIYKEMQVRGIVGNSFFDFFAGTASVGKYFKQKGYQVYSSDILYFSYVLQMAYIVNNEEAKFDKLLKEIKINSSSLFPTPLQRVVEFLNEIEPVEGFIYCNYSPEGSANLDVPRMYYSDENGKKIDSIRQQIETWRSNNLITEKEYFVLLACLIETVPFYANITGVYGAFQKKWDVRALKKLKLRPINLVTNSKENFAYNCNSLDLLDRVKTDIIYLDPPYNQRQYAPNYHLLETIAKYDNPEIKGVTGLRKYDDQKSNFCNPRTAIKELAKIAENAKYKWLILSYNSEGIMPKEQIMSTLSKYGDLDLVEFEYLRYKSNNNGQSKHKKHVFEQLFILSKKD